MRRCKEQKVSHFVAALKQCGKTRDLETGKVLHEATVSAGVQNDKYIASVLITMYSRCRSTASAREVFDGVVYKDAAIWNSLMAGYVENGEYQLAMELFPSITCQPSRVTYLIALKACGGLAGAVPSKRQFCLGRGGEIHEQVRKRGLENEVTVATSLIDMYCKCGCMELSRETFSGMRCQDAIAWTTLILGYVHNGQPSLALELFASMDVQPDAFTYSAALNACASLAAEVSEKEFCMDTGVRLHEQAKALGFESDIVVANTLLDMYIKCDRMVYAREVFERMSAKDIVTWNTLLMGYVESGESREAIDLFSRIDCHPEPVTYICALKACSRASSFESEKEYCLRKGIEIHRLVKYDGFESDLVLATALIDMYCKCSCMERARDVFDRMRSRDVVAWTSIISGYVVNGEPVVALELFSLIDCQPDSLTFAAALRACSDIGNERGSQRELYLRKGIEIHNQVKESELASDLILANSLLEMYRQCGSVGDTQEVFDRLIHRDVVSWNTLIAGYVECSQETVALDLFDNMDCEPSPVTYAAALKACGSLTALPTGKRIHARICKLGLERDTVLVTGLIDFYAKCGCMNVSGELLNNMHSPNVVSWTSLMAGYCSAGDPMEVFRIANIIQEADLKMDELMYTSILSVCSHAGLVEEAKWYLKSMLRRGVRFRLEHCNCIVDMFCRANRVEEAVALIYCIPFECNAVTWKTLLAAATKWNNVKVGKFAFDVAAEKDSAAYVLWSECQANYT